MPNGKKPKGIPFAELWNRAKKGSGWTGKDDEKEAFAIILSGEKGVSIIPQGTRENLKKLADGFSVMAGAGSLDVKMIEIEKVEVYEALKGRFAIQGGGVSIIVAVRENERIEKFFKTRIDKKKPLRLVLSLSDVHE